MSEHVNRLNSKLIRAEARVRELEIEVQALQRALTFWHPGVPEGPDEIATRAGEDAYLLAGYDGPDEQSARDLGWITLVERT